jgi:hypothetical protein
MNSFKQAVGLIAAGLVLVGYIPYIRDILKGLTKPHVFSWALWAIVTGIAFSLQVSANAGPGSLVTLAAALMCLVVLGLGMKQGKKNIKPIDGIFLFLALISLGLWLLAKQPVLSIILVTLIDIFGFLPTVRKSIDDPYSETLSFYWINTFRFGLAIIALNEYSIITALYPVSWSLINFTFAIFLFSARRKLIINHIKT